MITHKRESVKSGIYGVYWEIQEDDDGAKSTMVVQPDKNAAPQDVKIVIAQALLNDLEIPIRIDDYAIRIAP